MARAGKAELWHQSPATQNLVPTEVAGHLPTDAGIPFPGANWSKLAEMQEDSPGRACGSGVCLTIREDRGWWHKVLKVSLSKQLWWRWGVPLAAWVYMELYLP